MAFTVSVRFSMHTGSSTQLTYTGENLNQEPLQTRLCMVAAA